MRINYIVKTTLTFSYLLVFQSCFCTTPFRRRILLPLCVKNVNYDTKENPVVDTTQSTLHLIVIIKHVSVFSTCNAHFMSNRNMFWCLVYASSLATNLCAPDVKSASVCCIRLCMNKHRVTSRNYYHVVNPIAD